MNASSARRRSKSLAWIVGLLLIIGLAVAFCGPIAWRTGQYALLTYRDMRDWRQKTSPLDPEVIEDLCRRLGLSLEDARCQEGSVVYAPEFFDDVVRAFPKQGAHWATYTTVQDILGAYQYRYDPLVTTGDGLSYFRAHYDLRGDRVFPITMFFYEDGRLFRIIATVAK